MPGLKANKRCQNTKWRKEEERTGMKVGTDSEVDLLKVMLKF